MSGGTSSQKKIEPGLTPPPAGDRRLSSPMRRWREWYECRGEEAGRRAWTSRKGVVEKLEILRLIAGDRETGFWHRNRKKIGDVC